MALVSCDLLSGKGNVPGKMAVNGKLLTEGGSAAMRDLSELTSVSKH
jgi:hypothetical protein